MNSYNPLLLVDFYKTTHPDQHPKELTFLASYMTPRASRIKYDHMVVFGIQAFNKEYLIKAFNEQFFAKDIETVIEEYKRVLSATIQEGSYNPDRIRQLHALGYLPIRIRQLPEGTLVPMHIPIMEITATHTDFAWLVQTIESLYSAETWHTMVSATVGHMYREIVNKWYDETTEGAWKKRALGDFSFRGQHCVHSAAASSAGWLLSFVNTATVPAILYCEDFYNCRCDKEEVGYGAISTEHSCMCTNFAVDGDEETHLRRLLTEIYPNKSFSAVVDTYDYWKVITEILPRLKKEIMQHDGCFLPRGDSGNPIEIVTQTVYKLWDIFGGTTNGKGYKVLDPHVRAVYGDAITIERADNIFAILEENGFAANNVVLGSGSFSMMCIEEDGILKPFTRDTFGIANKSTYGEIDGRPIMLFKDPKTDDGTKRSQRGMCSVKRNPETGVITFIDGLTRSDPEVSDNLLEEVFCDSHMVKEYSLAEVRANLNGPKGF